MAKARLPISKHMPAARIGKRHLSPFTCSRLIIDAGNTIDRRGCSTHIIVCGWQNFTEAAWLYTDALQKAPESAELHEGRAAALLVRFSCGCTTKSKDVDDCGATVVRSRLPAHECGNGLCRLQERDWAGDAWAALRDCEDAGVLPSRCRSLGLRTSPELASAALLRVRALLRLGLAEVRP